jgi:hypothetical protein
MTDVVCVIVDPCSTFVIHVPWLDRHEISVIVVSKEDRHIVRDFELDGQRSLC